MKVLITGGAGLGYTVAKVIIIIVAIAALVNSFIKWKSDRIDTQELIMNSFITVVAVVLLFVIVSWGESLL